MLFSQTCLAQVVLSLLFSATVIHGLAPERRATVCNGHAELCERSYGTVSFVGAHDSYAIGVNNRKCHVHCYSIQLISLIVATNQDQDSA